jgi:hypothetical protein
MALQLDGMFDDMEHLHQLARFPTFTMEAIGTQREEILKQNVKYASASLNIGDETRRASKKYIMEQSEMKKLG